ncbi:MAG: hypothetical protein ACYDBA_02030 [Sulfuricaulis sp.]
MLNWHRVESRRTLALAQGEPKPMEALAQKLCVRHALLLLPNQGGRITRLVPGK